MKNQNTANPDFYKNSNAWLDKPAGYQAAVFSYAQEYSDFLGKYKTEREITAFLSEARAGMLESEHINAFTPSTCTSYFFRHKTAAFVRIPSKTNIKKPVLFRIICSHIDSPRLDLKPHPLIEESSLLLMKTHYYGGIKKYQWAGIPLELRGIICTEKNIIDVRNLFSGEIPRFIIHELPVHLSSEQLKKEGSKVVEGEEMTALAGHIPVSDEEQAIKTGILDIFKKNGIYEKNLLYSELCLVPAVLPCSVGFDHGLIAGYGHDDRACAWAEYRAFLDAEKNDHINIALWVDKEETGSAGDTGAQSVFIDYIYEKIIEKNFPGLSLHEARMRTEVLSADVTAALDPNNKQSFDAENSSLAGCGVSIEKYGGRSGKYGSHDAPAEYMHKIVSLLDQKKISWQTGELGKIDLGGGGTVAMFFARNGSQVIDAGPPVLGLHSPVETASKADLFETKNAYQAFFSE